MEHLADNILASSIVFLAFLVILGLVYSFFAWRNTKQTVAAADFIKNLHVGQRVKTHTGMYGVVTSVSKETVDVECAPNVVITFDRWALTAASKQNKYEL